MSQRIKCGAKGRINLQWLCQTKRRGASTKGTQADKSIVIHRPVFTTPTAALFSEDTKLRDTSNASYKKYVNEREKPSNTDVEMYALNENGGAKWLWRKNDGKNGVVIDDEKIGTWDANENSMTIRIKSNSGIIDETYELKDGTFINSQLANRYLKLTK